MAPISKSVWGRKSRGFTKEMAKDALKARLGEIAQGRFNLEKVRKPVPSSKLAERYREFASGYKRGWEAEKYIVDEFAELFSTTPLANITTWQIEKWKAEKWKAEKWKAEKWKAEKGKELDLATVNRRLTVIKHMFRKAVDWAGHTGINMTVRYSHLVP